MLGLGPAMAGRLRRLVAGRGAKAAALAGPSGSLLRPLAEALEAAGAGPARARLPSVAALCACAGAPLERRSPATWPAGSEAPPRRRGPGRGEGEFYYAWRACQSRPSGHYTSHDPPLRPPPQICPSARGRCRVDLLGWRFWSGRGHVRLRRRGRAGADSTHVDGRAGGKADVVALAPTRHPNPPLDV